MEERTEVYLYVAEYYPKLLCFLPKTVENSIFLLIVATVGQFYKKLNFRSYFCNSKIELKILCPRKNGIYSNNVWPPIPYLHSGVQKFPLMIHFSKRNKRQLHCLKSIQGILLTRRIKEVFKKLRRLVFQRKNKKYDRKSAMSGTEIRGFANGQRYDRKAFEIKTVAC